MQSVERPLRDDLGITSLGSPYAPPLRTRHKNPPPVRGSILFSLNDAWLMRTNGDPRARSKGTRNKDMSEDALESDKRDGLSRDCWVMHGGEATPTFRALRTRRDRKSVV